MLLSAVAAAAAIRTPSVGNTRPSPPSAAAALPPSLSRRSLLAWGTGAAALAAGAEPAAARRLKDLTAEEQDALDLANRDPALARPTASGLKVLDVLENEEGYAPKLNDQVYAHYKIWNKKGWRSGVPADSSYLTGQPIGWTLGQPPKGLIAGIDEGVRGMHEGEWRRLIVPSELAYGSSGKRQGSSDKSYFVVQTGEEVYVDVLLMPGALCDEALSKPKEGLEVLRKFRSASITCGEPSK